MSNVTTLIFVESRYKINRKRVKQVVTRVLASNNIQTNVEVSVAFVGDRKMRGLNSKYRGKDTTTNILSFSLSEGEPSKTEGPFGMPEGVVRLGDIVLSYPQVIKESARDDMLVDEKVEQLVEHGLLHLLGIHHDAS